MARKKSLGKNIIRTSIGICICLILALFIFYRYASITYQGTNTRINIPQNTDFVSLQDTLVSNLGDKYGHRVAKIFDLMNGKNAIRPGSYIIKNNEKAWQLARRIKNGQQDPIRVTYNNIRLWDDFTKRLSGQFSFSTSEFNAAADSILAQRGVSRRQYPAFFFPDTYEFYWTDTPQKVISVLLGHYDNFWNNDRCQKARDLGLTPVQLSVLASIVEEESNKTDERPTIGRLYLNRLKKGMKLQADPTVKFAVGDFGLRRINSGHLRTVSPYNTYQVTGLPPGPIRFVSPATIDGILNSPPNNYIFMCAKEDFSGYHNFADNYATHQANATRYRQALDRRNIK